MSRVNSPSILRNDRKSINSDRFRNHKAFDHIRQGILTTLRLREYSRLLDVEICDESFLL